MLACALGLGSCAALREPAPEPASPQAERQRIAAARIALEGLDEVDAVVTLNNATLGEHLAEALRAQAALGGAFVLDETRIRFEDQRIAIETIVIREGREALAARGDIELGFGGEALEWYPVFRDVGAVQAGLLPWRGAGRPDAHTRESLLAELNRIVARGLVDRGGNTIPLNIVPAAELSVGASLPGRGREARAAAPLGDAVFVPRGAVTVVGPEATRLVLDLAFQPSLAACPQGVSVSRALFASEVRDREPLAAGLAAPGGDAQFFYSEIAGATEPMTVVHYWFADGSAIAVTELPVEPSARWRTWSSRGDAGEDAQRYQVLVVDKATGCILHSQAVRVVEDIIDIPGPADTAAGLREALAERTGGFSAEVPPVAAVEVRRAFLAEVLQAGAGELAMDIAFDAAPYPEAIFTAQLFSPGSAALDCGVEACDAEDAVACSLSLDGCERLRDTRDCTSCLFRNPLNNRCVRQAVDPICEAARTRQNARYEAEWRACVQQAEDSLAACEARRAQTGAAFCAADTPGSAARCEALTAFLDALPAGQPLASVRAAAVERGTLGVMFSGFEIDGDFERLRVDMALRSRMTYSGRLDVATRHEAEPIVACLDAWSGPFAGRLDSVGPGTRMVATLTPSDGAFVARWSGWALPFRLDPAPLEVRGTGAGRPVQACGGLDAGEFARAVVGEGAAYLAGDRRIELVPAPTRLGLGTAEFRLGGRVYRAPPAVGPETVRWNVGG